MSARWQVGGAFFETAAEALAAHQAGDDCWVYNESSPTEPWSARTFEELKYAAEQEAKALDPEEVP